MRKQFGKDFTAMTPKVKYLVKKKKNSPKFFKCASKDIIKRSKKTTHRIDKICEN